MLSYVSGKIRHWFIHILPGDRIKIEVSRYDSNRRRIISRLLNKDSTGEAVFQHSFHEDPIHSSKISRNLFSSNKESRFEIQLVKE
uniref:translational initiation factor 1 n=1 Tax=Sapindus rarak TaxID=1679327 RepID=UPI002238CEEF|nr:translational initiation factor 1 [Sapindus rarak]UYA95496.1 translational initiation factor 1 [Sapindus rarak]UYA95587.1 translational initiation factor 1 [Sapindus delavayi]